MTEDDKTTKFGEPVGLYWKGRFIIGQDGRVDLPWDRSAFHGPGSHDKNQKDALAKQLDDLCSSKALFAIIREKLISREILTREAADVVLFEGGGLRVRGNSNASAGYLYVIAERVGEAHPAIDALDQARDTYYESTFKLQLAAEAAAWEIVLRYFPTAVEFTTNGSWESIDGPDTAVRLTLQSVKGPDGKHLDGPTAGQDRPRNSVDDAEHWSKKFSELETALDESEVLLVLGDIGADDYIGEHTFEKEEQG